MKSISKSSHEMILHQLRMMLGIVLLVTVVGSVGYWIIGQHQGHDWAIFDCLYMTLITVTTVGYSEVFDLAHSPGARIYTMVLLVFGCGAMLTCFSIGTAFFVEGSMGAIFWRRRMQKRIDKLRDHIIVCGGGATGTHIVDELLKMKQPFVVIERDEQQVQELIEGYNPLILVGDAEDGDVLEAAGIHNASGLVAALSEDKDNVYVVITARALNPNLRIVAKGVDPDSDRKLKHAGASSVVSPSRIGGLRLASEMIRPKVVGFLDRMIHDTTRVIRVEEISIPEDSPLAGIRLRDSMIYEKTGLTVIAVAYAGQHTYTYNPAGDLTLRKGATLIVVGEVSQVQRLRGLVAGETPQERSKFMDIRV